MPTATAAEPVKAPAETPHVARIISSDSIPAGGFTPGTILADRYRIIGLLGRGGMGEVYRADDLKLGQAVALKFLPPKLAEDPVRRERFFAEVRITRQLSHPNICRVYDIGEIQGRHFLSMEFIDGEDLASLIRRIGHLSNEKALDIARQLAAGLAAAHEHGVLHRDLKPANIMLDGHGRVRITDFGLAIAAEEAADAAEIAGTPAYMAPEQLAGKGATVRSDMYSLGLVLYEVYTGKKAFTAMTLAELREQKETHTPRAISELREGMDPVVERLIRRCMERDSNARPSSVAQLALALPGGDPLAAAIAAGETPSPEMVAASGSKEGLKPWIAWASLAFIILGIGAAVLLGRQSRLLERVKIENSPEVMAKIARDILKDAGYNDPPADSAFGFQAHEAYFQYLEKNDQSPARYDSLPAFMIQFWYRQSPGPLEHGRTSPFEAETVSLTDPPVLNNGEAVVWLDSCGSLIGLRVVPPDQQKASSASQPPDWSTLFKAANLDQAKFAAVEPDKAPLAFADMRAAWTGCLKDRPDVPIHIEAAAFRGKPVVWRISIPDRGGQSIPLSLASNSQWETAKVNRMRVVLVLILTVVSTFFARRNLRMGRGDRRGAVRLSIFMLLLLGIAWIFGEHHVSTFGEFDLFLNAAAVCLALSGLLWLLYVAFEPFVRRRLPGWLVGWSRLIAGKVRDPLVGRDLLAGCMMGVSLVLLNYLRFSVSLLFSATPLRPSGTLMSMLENFGWGTLYLLSGAPRTVVSSLSMLLVVCMILSFVWSFWFFVAQTIFRRTWAAIVVVILMGTVINTLGLREPTLSSAIPVALGMGIILFVLLRFGLLASAAGVLCFHLLLDFPITMQLSVWYAGIGVTGLVLLLALALYAFHTSLGGQPLFGTPRLDD